LGFVLHSEDNLCNRAFGMNHRAIISTVPILVFVAVSCSSPTDPTRSLLLESILADLPLSPPQQTSDNIHDWGFQWVTGKCDTLQSAHYFDLNWWIEPFLEERIHPEKVGSAYQWRRPFGEASLDEIILTVIPGDSISFRIEWSVMNAYHTGWVIPAESRGYLSAYGGVREWYWGPTAYGFHLVMEEYDPAWEGLRFEMADSTCGGGFFFEKLGIELRFSGNWDSVGHGEWWCFHLGSGDW
jgi:hypothetical protein